MGTNIKSICLKDYDAVGFDIDHTLAKYNIPNLFNVVYDSFGKCLVEKRGYDATLRQPFDIHKDLCSRGLILDLCKGNFLKVGKDGVILRANHGTKTMTEEEIVNIYGKDKLFQQYDSFVENVDNIKTEDGNGIKYFMFDNYFDVVGEIMIARIIDSIDKKEKSTDCNYNIWADVQAAYGTAYQYLNFEEKVGGFFPAVQEDPVKYIDKLSTEVKAWIKKLKEDGKILFLMTSSFVDFASFSMNYIMGPDWKNDFDFILTYSRKPSFFFSNNHFRRLDGTSEKEPIVDLEKGGIYSQGNVATLDKLLVKMTGKETPKVLYFGDGLRADIAPSKKYAKWDTVYIYEEMETERGQVVKTEKKNGEHSPQRTNEEDNDEPAKKKPKTSESNGTTTAISDKERDYVSSARWGSLLVDDIGHSGRLESTMFGIIMRKYTDLAIPQLSHIAALPLEHKFSCIEQHLSTSGFYPRPPEILRNLNVGGDSSDKDSL